MLRTFATVKDIKLARTAEGRRIIVQLELPTNIDMDELWDMWDFLGKTSIELFMMPRQLPLRMPDTPAVEDAAADALESNAAAVFASAAPDLAEPPSDEGWYFRIGENDERGPFPGPIEAAEAIGLIKRDLEASQLPSFDFTDPYQRGTGELGEVVEERLSDEEMPETVAAYAETPEGEMDEAREDALFGKEIDTELGADVAAQIQADRMSQFEPTVLTERPNGEFVHQTIDEVAGKITQAVVIGSRRKRA